MRIARIESSNPNVATIDLNLTVSMVGPGTAAIRAWDETGAEIDLRLFPQCPGLHIHVVEKPTQ